MKPQWNVIGESEKGTPYGHVPGHQYHDVSVTIGKRGEKIRAEVVGSLGRRPRLRRRARRNRAVAIDADLDAAVRIANSRAKGPASARIT